MEEEDVWPQWSASKTANITIDGAPILLILSKINQQMNYLYKRVHDEKDLTEEIHDFTDKFNETFSKMNDRIGSLEKQLSDMKISLNEANNNTAVKSNTTNVITSSDVKNEANPIEESSLSKTDKRKSLAPIITNSETMDNNVNESTTIEDTTNLSPTEIDASITPLSKTSETPRSRGSIHKKINTLTAFTNSKRKSSTINTQEDKLARTLMEFDKRLSSIEIKMNEQISKPVTNDANTQDINKIYLKLNDIDSNISNLTIRMNTLETNNIDKDDKENDSSNNINYNDLINKIEENSQKYWGLHKLVSDIMLDVDSIKTGILHQSVDHTSNRPVSTLVSNNINSNINDKVNQLIEYKDRNDNKLVDIFSKLSKLEDNNNINETLINNNISSIKNIKNEIEKISYLIDNNINTNIKKIINDISKLFEDRILRHELNNKVDIVMLEKKADSDQVDLCNHLINDINKNIKTLNENNNEKIKILEKSYTEKLEYLSQWLAKRISSATSNNSNFLPLLPRDIGTDIGKIKCLVCDQPIGQQSETETVFGGPPLKPTMKMLRSTSPNRPHTSTNSKSNNENTRRNSSPVQDPMISNQSNDNEKDRTYLFMTSDGTLEFDSKSSLRPLTSPSHSTLFNKRNKPVKFNGLPAIDSQLEMSDADSKTDMNIVDITTNNTYNYSSLVDLLPGDFIVSNQEENIKTGESTPQRKTLETSLLSSGILALSSPTGESYKSNFKDIESRLLIGQSPIAAAAMNRIKRPISAATPKKAPQGRLSAMGRS